MTREEINEKKQKAIEGENRKERIKKIVKVFLKTTIVLAIIITLFFSYTTYISSVKINVREYRIINEKIPDSLNGTKIIHFSDLHYGSTMFEENLKDIKKLINERNPDIIVFTGDLIAKDYKITSKEKEKLSKELKSLNAKLGKYAVLGDEDEEDITTIFNQSDFYTLKNEYDLIYNEQNSPILLVGISSLLKEEQDLEKAYSYFKQETYNANIYTISLVHEPDTATDITNMYSSDLILSGHSLNGTIQIPFANIPLIQKKGAKIYQKEHYSIGNTELYISSGLGVDDEIGIRLFCRPSINLYRISNK